DAFDRAGRGARGDCGALIPGQDPVARALTTRPCATMSIASRKTPGGGTAAPAAQASTSLMEAPSVSARRSMVPSVSIARRNVLVYALSDIQKFTRCRSAGSVCYRTLRAVDACVGCRIDGPARSRHAWT